MKGPLKSAMRVLPPDVFDALELSALVFGGIGAVRYWDCWPDRSNEPCCSHGHAMAITGTPVRFGGLNTLARIGITTRVNDDAVGTSVRIPFKKWCRRLNVVRADTPTYDAAFVALVSSQTKKERGAGRGGSRVKRGRGT